MFDIQTVSYTDAQAPAAFTRSLRETGFAVLTDHPIGPEHLASVDLGLTVQPPERDANRMPVHARRPRG